MNFLDNAVQFVKKNDSKILLVASVILGGATIVTTIKSTRKVEPILNDHKEKMTDIKMATDMGVMVDKETKESFKYSEVDARKDTFNTYAKTAGKIAYLYRWPIVLGVGSLGCNLASHKILSEKNFGLQAALAGVTESFNSYRSYTTEKYGKDADTEAMYGIKQEKKKVKDGNEDVAVYSETKNDGLRLTCHARLLDECSGSRIWNRERQSVLNSLVSIEQSVQRKLKMRRSHTVSFNEIADMLDVDPADDGNVMGLKFTPGGKLNEFGLPDIRVFDYWLLNNNGKYVRKTVDEELDHPTSFDPAILIDFPNLVYIG